MNVGVAAHQRSHTSRIRSCAMFRRKRSLLRKLIANNISILHENWQKTIHVPWRKRVAFRQLWLLVNFPSRDAKFDGSRIGFSAFRDHTEKTYVDSRESTSTRTVRRTPTGEACRRQWLRRRVYWRTRRALGLQLSTAQRNIRRWPSCAEYIETRVSLAR